MFTVFCIATLMQTALPFVKWKCSTLKSSRIDLLFSGYGRKDVSYLITYTKDSKLGLRSQEALGFFSFWQR